MGKVDIKWWEIPFIWAYMKIEQWKDYRERDKGYKAFFKAHPELEKKDKK